MPSRSICDYGRVELSRVDDLRDLLVEIAPQPFDRRELDSVSLLVQADPQPEVGRIHSELTLDGDDVRGDQEQAAARLTVGPSAGKEGVELTEHLRRQVAEQRSDLDAGDPRTDAGHRRIAVLQLLGDLVVERVEDLPEPVEVGLDPARAVDHQDGRSATRCVQPRDFGDVGLGPRRAAAKLRDRRRRALPGDLRTRFDQPGRRT